MTEKIKRRFLLASDTHGNTQYLENVLRAFSFDGLIFCGDGEGLESVLVYLPGCPAELSMVRGNNDWNPGLANDIVIPFGDRKAFVTHGHRYRLYEGLDALGMAAVARNCEFCIFGHIHRPFCMRSGSVVFINPGSLAEPRQEDRIPTYAILETEAASLRVRFINAVTLSEYRLMQSEESVFEF